MKKIKAAVTVLALVFAVCVLGACGLFTASVKSITLLEQPKTEYQVGEAFDTDFRIKVTYSDQTEKEVAYTNSEGITFENDFSSAAAGTFTCTISVKGYSGVTYSFNYSVVDPNSGFAGGTGSMADPYLVTSAEQFTNIGKEDGKYYKLGNDIDLTTVTPKDNVFRIYTQTGKMDSSGQCYATSVSTDASESATMTGGTAENPWKVTLKGINLDGQNYAVTFGGEGVTLFGCLYNAKIENLRVNYAPGSSSVAIAGFLFGECVFEDVTMNGTMSAGSNTAGVAWYTWRATKITLNNCVGNVNYTGTAPYCSAFLGLLYSVTLPDGTTAAPEITFNNCTNNGNLEGDGAYVFIANGSAATASNVKINNCANTGKLVGKGVGLVNMAGTGTTGLVPGIENYTCSGVGADKLVAVGPYLKDSSGNDITLVKNGTNVVFNTAVASKLEEEFGEGYTVKAYVRDWVKYSLGTTYLFTEAKDLSFNAPYMAPDYSNKDSLSDPNGLVIQDGKLMVAGTNGDKTIVGPVNESKPTQSLYYCYFIYDSTGAMKYCGTIAYADVQDA